MEIQTSGGESIGILKKIKDADPADSHHASLEAAKKQDTVKQDMVTVTILTNLRQGEAEEKEEAVTLTATIVTNLRQGEAEEKGEVVSPSFSAPWSVLFGRGEPRDSCTCPQPLVFFFSADQGAQHECKFLCECLDT